MKSHKNILRNLQTEDAITLTLSGTDSVRGTYAIGSVRGDEWNQEFRISLDMIKPLDAGGLTSAEIWFAIDTGRIRKIIARSKACNGRIYTADIHKKDQLRGCNLRTRDWIFSTGDALNIHKLANLIVTRDDDGDTERFQQPHQKFD